MSTPLPKFSFGDTPETNDRLLALVLEGKKSATCSALDEYKKDNSLLPKPGDQSIVIDSQGAARCIIETTEVSLKRFNEVDQEFATLEGEGDGSLAYWQNEHARFFRKTGAFNPNMLLVCEKFKVIQVL